MFPKIYCLRLLSEVDHLGEIWISFYYQRIFVCLHMEYIAVGNKTFRNKCFFFYLNYAYISIQKLRFNVNFVYIPME